MPVSSPIWFYVPSPALVADAPSDIRDYWPWIDGAVNAAPATLANGNGPCTWLGPYNWTIQTCLYLSESGIPCSLTATLPDHGIVIAHGDFLPTVGASARQFFVEIKPDRLLQCRLANFVIVQNRHDPLRAGWARALVPSAHVNYWPQPGMIPRDASRGDRFENVCFMGNPEQFLAETTTVEDELRKLGLSWRLVPRREWHDYSEVDAILAIRPATTPVSTSKEVASFFSHNRKPASKLYNAWLAGVPAILSPEIAFRDLRRSQLDYLEAANVAEAVTALARLQGDPALRRAMRDNGHSRAYEFSAERTAAEWKSILEHRIIPRFDLWRRSRLPRLWLHGSRSLLERLGAT